MTVSKPVTVESKFGTYQNHFSFSNGELRYFRSVSQKHGVYTPSDYADFAAYYQAIHQ